MPVPPPWKEFPGGGFSRSGEERTVPDTDHEVIKEVWVLTPNDRCDKCGAQAYMLATLDDGDLLFCAHHAAKFRDTLVAAGAEILDETERLKNLSHHIDMEGGEE